MKNKLFAYIVLFFVFLASLLTYAVFPPESILRVVSATPGVAALFLVLVQLVRDQARYERELHLQERQFQFSIGAASHMANVAFDRHVSFCEAYLTEVQNAARTMFAEGDSPKALEHASKLGQLREAAAVWLTESIDRDLSKFEQELRKLGANAHLIQETRGDDRHRQQRSIAIDENFEEIGRLLGIGGSRGDEVSESSALEDMKIRVRNILGIEELTSLREHLVKNASSIMNSAV